MCLNCGLPVGQSGLAVLAMASPLLTYLENYHWKGYRVDTIVDQANTMMCLHSGKFPMHRYCRNVNIGHTPFNLMEAWVWIYREKWNILWAEEDTWLPQDSDVIVRLSLPHGFHRVLINETDDEYLQTWVEVAGRGFYPFAAEARHYGYACWANSRRFAIVARSPQQCAIIAEVMHLYNLLGNRLEVYAPRTEGIALTDYARINNAVHEDDRPCFNFRGSQTCQNAIAGRFPIDIGDIERLYQLSEGIHILQRRHNDLVQEANQALYRAQQSWHALSEAYAAFFNGEAISQAADEPN